MSPAGEIEKACFCCGDSSGKKVHFKDALSGKFPGSPQTQCLAGKTPGGQ
ncbi:hypothetical protein SAMN02745131_01616 [Flavisolibacter ginsengisoli DSM 18119]|jgi:hypothetical protein|uniref:Uncharacterized protein n=1 Tax=Flavisolibacter ginsengisoli DSM 18119 TaxID=1121884 RepID=A0A1M4Y6L1_9BACT|nr:hypothetical protein SAMN02745131_01616 [Flavisolibacter ginsengisoli DSM 18119]